MVSADLIWAITTLDWIWGLCGTQLCMVFHPHTECDLHRLGVWTRLKHTTEVSYMAILSHAFVCVGGERWLNEGIPEVYQLSCADNVQVFQSKSLPGWKVSD